MERIAILNNTGDVIAFIDNSAPDCLHYYDAELVEYLTGSSYTFGFTVDTIHEDAQKIQVGNHLSFKRGDKEYFLNIVTCERTEDTIQVTCIGLVFELIFETLGPYKAKSAMSFMDYIKAFNFEFSEIYFSLNEVSDKKITHEWTGSDTVLARLYSLADVFGAELEFITVLNPDYTLRRLKLNIYKTGNMGENRTGEVLRFGDQITAIEKSEDITDLCTAIRPHGQDKDGNTLTLVGYEGHAKDANGHYDSPKSSDVIECREARDRFPSILPYPHTNYYICKTVDYDTDNQAQLWAHALADLKKDSVPKLTYKISGFTEASPGDTFTIEDTGYTPTMYLQARVLEVHTHPDDPAQNSLVFGNFIEEHSQINAALISQMQEMIAAHVSDRASIASTNGLFFKNSFGTTTLSAHIYRREVDVTDRYTIQWYKDGVKIAQTQSVNVAAKGINGRQVWRFEGLQDGTVKVSADVTVLNVMDGHTPAITAVKKYDTTLISADGKQIAEIKDGTAQKLVSNVPEYYLSTSDTKLAGGTWSPVPNEFTTDKHQWTRWMATYTNPDAVAYSDPVLDSTWKATGEAISKATEADTSAKEAIKQATQAGKTATDAASQAAQMAKDMDPLKADIKAVQQQVTDDIAKQKTEILSDIAGKYAAADDLTKVESDLSEKITANASAISSKVSESDYQKNSDAINDKLKAYSASMTQAQSDLADLKEDSKALVQAQKDLKDAQDRVSALEKDQSANADEIAAAKKAAADAQDQVTKAQKAVDSANAEITAAQKTITQAKSDLASLTDRMSKAETSITQNSSDISLKADQTAVDQAKKSLESELSVGLNGITTDVSKRFSSLSVGGRNLLLKSDVPVTNANYTIQNYTLTETPIEGDDYILTIWGSLGSDREAFYPYNSGGLVNLGPAMPKIADGVYQSRFKWKNTGIDPESTFISVYQFKQTGKTASAINRIKLEKGTTPTDWSPAPEDLESYTDTKINQSADSLSITISQTAAQRTNEQFQKLQAQIDQYAEYFRFSADGLEIGKSGSPIQLHEQNDKIAFSSNGQDQMFLEAGVLNIAEIDIKTTLKLGPLTITVLPDGKWEIR